MPYYYGLPSDVWRIILSLGGPVVKFKMRLTGHYFRSLIRPLPIDSYIIWTPVETVIFHHENQLRSMIKHSFAWIQDQTDVVITEINDYISGKIIDHGHISKSIDGTYARSYQMNDRLLAIDIIDSNVKLWGSFWNRIRDRFVTYYNWNNEYGAIKDCYELIIDLEILASECNGDEEWCMRSNMYLMILTFDRINSLNLYRLDVQRNSFHLIIPLKTHKLDV